MFGNLTRREALIVGVVILITSSGTAGAFESIRDKISRLPVYSANEFLASIGLNCHFNFGGTPYVSLDDMLISKIVTLGVRRVRDQALAPVSTPGAIKYYDRLRKLSSHGVHFDLVVFDATRPAAITPLGSLEPIRQSTGDSVDFFEGSNEPDLSGTPNWNVITHERQRDLFESRSVNHSVSSYGIIGPSPSGKIPSLVGDLSAFVDFGNVHSYSGGLSPETAQLGSLRSWLERMQMIFPGRPFVVTETGYHSAMSVPRPKHRPTPEDVVSVYLPRLLLFNFASGIKASFLYELADRKPPNDAEPESAFGLLRFNGEEKPAFKVLRSMIHLVEGTSDVGATVFPELRVEVDSVVPNLYMVALAGDRGKTLLAFWVGEPSWDPDARARIDVAPRDFHLKVGGARFVSIHRLGSEGEVSREPIATGPNGAHVTASASVAFVELVRD